MQTLSVGATSVVIDDETASAIVWYSVQLAKAHLTECVEVQGYDVDDQPVTAQLVLGETAAVSAVTAHSELPDPDNADALDRIRADTERLENPPPAGPEQAPPFLDGDPIYRF